MFRASTILAFSLVALSHAAAPPQHSEELNVDPSLMDQSSAPASLSGSKKELMRSEKRSSARSFQVGPRGDLTDLTPTRHESEALTETTQTASGENTGALDPAAASPSDSAVGANEPAADSTAMAPEESALDLAMVQLSQAGDLNATLVASSDAAADEATSTAGESTDEAAAEASAEAGSSDGTLAAATEGTEAAETAATEGAEAAAAAGESTDEAAVETRGEAGSLDGTLAATADAAAAESTLMGKAAEEKPAEAQKRELINLQAGEEFIPGMMGKGGPAVTDIAYRGMDMMMGTTGIIDEDYPFACVCNQRGVCERDAMQTPCPQRAGHMAATVRNGASIGFLTLIFAALWGAV